MKGSIIVCMVKEKLDRTSPPRQSEEFVVGKLNAPMIK